MLPEPKYRVEFVNSRGHWYDVYNNGSAPVRLPGVTGILDVISKPALVPWAKKEALKVVEASLLRRLGQMREINAEWIKTLMEEAKQKPEKIKTEAANIGTRVHEYADLWLQGIRSVPPDDIAVPARTFQDWVEKTNIKFLHGDMPVASLRHGYGGRLDFIATLENKIILGDFKTSSGIWEEYILQVAAYVRALNEMYEVKCEEAVIVRFDKVLPIEPEIRWLTASKLNMAFRGFLAAKKLKETLCKLKV